MVSIINKSSKISYQLEKDFINIEFLDEEVLNAGQKMKVIVKY
jgi:hypothetical protein